MEHTTKGKHAEVLSYTLVFVLLLAFSILWYRSATHAPIQQPQQQQAAAALPDGAERITVHGTIGCLQYRDTEAVHTMECAFALTDDAGNSYALNDTDPAYSHVSSVPSGARATVTGVFTPEESLQYNSIGTLQVETVTAE